MKVEETDNYSRKDWSGRKGKHGHCKAQRKLTAYSSGCAGVVVATAKVALARTPRVPLRAWQPSVESGRGSGVFPLTKNLPITIQELRAREKVIPAQAPLAAERTREEYFEITSFLSESNVCILLNLRKPTFHGRPDFMILYYLHSWKLT